MSETKLITLTFQAAIPQGHTVEVMRYRTSTFVRDVDTNITYGSRAEARDGVISEPKGEPKIQRGVVTRTLVVRSSRGDAQMATNIWIRPLAESEGSYR